LISIRYYTDPLSLLLEEIYRRLNSKLDTGYRTVNWLYLLFCKGLPWTVAARLGATRASQVHEFTK